MARHPKPRRARFGRAALVAVLLMILFPLSRPAAEVRAADPSADIPGVPLPGPIAAGRLGGAIYDVVYRLDVEPGHVIVASLTGTGGTDFDLYLFDSSATTVLSSVGLVTKSTGPTSSESVSWPTRAGGTFYVDLNGATDVEGDYRFTVQTLPDATPPLLSMKLASGAASTNALTVPVTLVATEDLSGIADMAFSADGIHFDPWQPFQSTSSWSFGPGDGPRFLWAKVRNGVGLESSVAGGSVAIDTVPPNVTSVDPTPGARVPGLRPTVTIGFDEPITPGSWLDLGLVVQSATGALVPGSFAYDVSTRHGSFTPTVDLIPGGTYVVTVGNVRDVAGNQVVFPGSWSMTPLSPTTLTATADTKVVARGGSVHIDLILNGAQLPATIDVSGAVGSGGFESRPPIPTVDGTNVLEVIPGANTTYRFNYAGTPSVADARADVSILVRRSVALVSRSASVVSSGRAGVPVRLTAQIGPARAGVSLSFRLYRYDSSKRRWTYAGSRGRSTDAAGRASYTWVPSSSGSYYWRVAVASTTDFANNTSPVYRWAIKR